MIQSSRNVRVWTSFAMSLFENITCDNRPVRVRGCNSPGCSGAGDYRAPKNRELSDYYWFCLDHVREYNRTWDYFSGMDAGEVEVYTRKATVWERPSWPLGDWRQHEQDLRDAIHREFFADTATEKPSAPAVSKTEYEALLVLELTAPISFAEIKSQYRILVKKYHPDANSGCRDAEEKFKDINQAFTVLKAIHEG